jgi:hypothetical protein
LIATQGRLFSHIGDTSCYCSSMCSPSDTTHSLSAEGHSCYDNNTRSLSLSLSLSLFRRSLARSMCSDFPAGLSRLTSPASRALRIVLNFSPQKAGAAAGRLTACVMAKGASRRRSRRPPHCRRGRNAVSDPPPRAPLVESPHQGGN